MSISISIVKDFSGFPTDVVIKQNNRKTELKVVNDSNFVIKGNPNTDMWHALSMVFNDVRSHKGAANWYDRNPLPIVRSYQADAVANHVNTERWAYTCPQNRKCFIELANLYIFCSSVSSFPAFLLENLMYTPLGGATQMIYALVVNAQVFGVPIFQATGQSFLMFPGDVITANTANQGDAGADYLLSLKGTEFDV
jgi:hypothetical protein